MLERAEEAKALGLRSLGVTGGEPLMVATMPETVAALAAVLPTVVLSNATLFDGSRLGRWSASPRATCPGPTPRPASVEREQPRPGRADPPRPRCLGRAQMRGERCPFLSRRIRTAPSPAGQGVVMPDVVLPALNEAAALPGVLRGLPAGFRAVVVDNGSTDDTAAVATELGALVVHEAQRGFGAACWAGLLAAEADVVCFMDADGSFAGTDLERVAAPVLDNQADLVLGARQPTAGSWPVHARLANRVLAIEIRRRTGLHLQDLGPMRAARREHLIALGMVDRRSGWPLEMVLRAHAARWTIHEVPVVYRPRVGRSKVTGTMRGTARAVADMAHALATVPAGPRATDG